MAKVMLSMLGSLLLVSFVTGSNYVVHRPDQHDYYEKRSMLLQEDWATYLGSDQSLTEEEKIANEHLMVLKRHERKTET